jgi:hypothetical protein
MRAPGGLFWIAIAFAAGIGNYAVKQVVQGLDDDLNSIHRKTAAAESKIHDLTAEWTYLNQPELLADLNRRYLGLVPITARQVRAGIADLPMRPATPPEPAPEPQTVAATVPAPTPAATPAAIPAPAIRTEAAIVPIDTAALVAPPAAPRAVATEPPKPPSLDALFAQVAGNR